VLKVLFEMFEINENLEIKKEYLEGSVIYTADNFYKNPDNLVKFLSFIDPIIWKEQQQPSNNMVEFEDKRHIINSKHVVKVYEFLRSICGIEDVGNEENRHLVITNVTRFKKSKFNDYKNNYWWPHKDLSRYAAIIYLNKNDDVSGTNIYKNLNPIQEPPDCPEHYMPWRSKNNYSIIKQLKPKYNRMVLFDGSKFFHGMNITNDDYFGEECRMNQVLFLGTY